MSGTIVPPVTYSPSVVHLKKGEEKRVFIQSEEGNAILVDSVQSEHSSILVKKDPFTNENSTVVAIVLSSTEVVTEASKAMVLVSFEIRSQGKKKKKDVVKIPVIITPE